MDQFGKEFIDYITLHWIQAGIFCAVICTYITGKNKLKKDGFLTLGEFLLGVFFMGLYMAGGWLTLIFLGMLLKDQFEELLKIKVFKTTEFKTKNLLYKEDEDD